MQDSRLLFAIQPDHLDTLRDLELKQFLVQFFIGGHVRKKELGRTAARLSDRNAPKIKRLAVKLQHQERVLSLRLARGQPDQKRMFRFRFKFSFP